MKTADTAIGGLNVGDRISEGGAILTVTEIRKAAKTATVRLTIGGGPDYIIRKLPRRNRVLVIVEE